MITNSERHFMEHWSEEKKGPRWKYYLLFTMAWSAVSFLVIFFLTKLFSSLWQTGGPNFIYVLIVIAVLIGFFSTHFSYVINEKKYHKIIEREKTKLN
ncbi:MAG TPA: hypothetical protein VFI29_12585 [Hanamia sp.]|nr:hypothetical protein [Hanamia sp.]